MVAGKSFKVLYLLVVLVNVIIQEDLGGNMEVINESKIIGNIYENPELVKP